MDKCEDCMCRQMVGIFADNLVDNLVDNMVELEENVEACVNEGKFVIIFTKNKELRSLISETLLPKFGSDDVCLEFI